MATAAGGEWWMATAVGGAINILFPTNHNPPPFAFPT